MSEHNDARIDELAAECERLEEALEQTRAALCRETARRTATVADWRKTQEENDCLRDECDRLRDLIGDTTVQGGDYRNKYHGRSKCAVCGALDGAHSINCELVLSCQL